jgi:CheY-like chemotaxis protein
METLPSFTRAAGRTGVLLHGDPDEGAMLPEPRFLLHLRRTHLPVPSLEDRGVGLVSCARAETRMPSWPADFTGGAARDAVSVPAKCIDMPGANGYEVAQHVRRTENPGKRTLLVAITGEMPPHEVAARCHEAGFDLHVAKPADVKALAEFVIRGITR